MSRLFLFSSAPKIALTSPTSRQIFQRSGTSGVVTIAGTYTGSRPRGIQVQTTSLIGGTPVSSWTSIGNFTSGNVLGKGNVFSGTITLAQGWYQMQVRATNTPGRILSIDRMGVGEVFVVAGQSNSANWGNIKNNSTNDNVSMFSQVGVWAQARDPQPSADGTGGSEWPLFSDSLYTSISVPIGVCTVGRDSTAIAVWQPGGTRYPNLKAALQLVGVSGCRCVLWFQGESDTALATSQSAYTTGLTTIVNQSRTDAGWTVPWVISTTSFYIAGTSGNQPAIRAAQAAVVSGVGSCFAGPDTDTLQNGGGTTYRWNGPDFGQVGQIALAPMWQSAVQTAFGI